MRTNVQHHPIPFVLQTFAGRTKNSVHAECASDPTKIQSEKHQAQCKFLIVPHYFVRIESRGKKCGDAPWQKDHWKAVDTITIMWQEDEKYSNTFRTQTSAANASQK